MQGCSLILVFIFKLLILPSPKLVQRPNTLLIPLLSRYPELLSVLHNVRQHRSAEEDHVLPSWGIFYPDFEFLCCITLY